MSPLAEQRVPSLLELVRGLLERTYDMRTGIRDIAPFVIGDEGFRRHYAGKRLHDRVHSWPAVYGAQVLLREEAGALHASVYYPDALIRTLEEHPPLKALNDENLMPFATLVEELDHLLVVAERRRLGRQVSLLELELHADVSKYLVLARFLAGKSRKLTPRRKAWLHWQLFERHAQDNEHDPVLRERYHRARRWAVRFLRGLSPLPARERTIALRRFSDADVAGKIAAIRALG